MLLKTKFHTIEEDTLEKSISELLKVSETEINEWLFVIKPHVVIGTHSSKLNYKRFEQFDFIKDNTEYSCKCYHQIDGIVEIQLKKKRTTRKKKASTNAK